MPPNLFARLAGAAFLLSLLCLLGGAFVDGDLPVTAFSYLFVAAILLLAIEGLVRMLGFVSGRSKP